MRHPKLLFLAPRIFVLVALLATGCGGGIEDYTSDTTMPAAVTTTPAPALDMNLSEARRSAIELVKSVTEGLGIYDETVSKFAEAALKDPTAYSCDQPKGYKRAESVIWSAASLAFVPETDTLMRETASGVGGLVMDFHEAPGLKGTKRWVYSIEFQDGFQMLVTMNVQGTSFSILTPCVKPA